MLNLNGDLAINFFMMLFDILSSFHYVPYYWDELVKEDSSLRLSIRALKLSIC